jgi:hypothetical protein
LAHTFYGLAARISAAQTVCLRDKFKRVQRAAGSDLKRIIHHQFIRERDRFALHHTFSGNDILYCINVDGNWALFHTAAVTLPTLMRQVRMKNPNGGLPKWCDSARSHVNG